jgi:hypothetical protein
MDIGEAHLKQAVLDLIAKLKQEWDVQIVKRQVYTEEEVKEKDMTIERLTQDLEEVFATLGKAAVAYSVISCIDWYTEIGILCRASSR